MNLPPMRICYHGAVGHRFPCSVEPVHIKPVGAANVICDSPSRVRTKAPAFVTNLMGATCKRCRERFARRLKRAARIASFRALVGAIAIVVSLSSFAQTVTICTASSDRLCKLTPPATYQMATVPPPFNAPVKFGEVVKVSGAPYWLWRKAGEPPTPCTAKTHSVSPGGHEPGCDAKIGDPFYVTQQFTVKPARSLAFAAASVAPRVSLSLAPQCSSLTEPFIVPRFACLRIDSPGDVVRFEVIQYPAYELSTRWVEAFPVSVDGSVTIPYRVLGEALGTRRVAIWGIDRNEQKTLLLADTRLLDLPIWTGR